MKQMLKSDELLIYPDFDEPFVIATDASSQGLAWALMQYRNGKLLPILYGGRSMKGCEQNYSIVELEALSIVCAIKVHEHLLINQDKEFTIQTDNRALTFIFDGATTTRNPKLLRYSLEIAGNKWYKITHVAGKLHQHVDSISTVQSPTVILVAAIVTMICGFMSLTSPSKDETRMAL